MEHVTSRLATDAEVATWRETGWVLLEGLVATEEIDALADDLREIFPSAEEHHADPEGVHERWRGRPKEPEEAFVWPDEGPGFRPAQQRWGAEFPFPGTGALNRMYVHASIVDFAERALGSEDIRLYQAHASAKYAGITNYEQPIHLDRNHSWLPAGSEAPWWNLEGFLYLTDVTDDDNPTRMVSVGDTEHIDNPYGVLMPRDQPRGLRSRAAGPGHPRLLSRLPLRHVPPGRPVRLGHGRPHRRRRRLQERRGRLDRLRHPAEPIDRDRVDPFRRGLDAPPAGALRLAPSRPSGLGRAASRTDAGSATRRWTSGRGGPGGPATGDRTQRDAWIAPWGPLLDS